MLHGLPGGPGARYELAAAYARAGVFVLSVSAPFNRHDQLDYRDARLIPAPLFTAHDRDEIVQLVRELRRAIDMLAAHPGIDRDHVAFVGHSYGGWIGALLASVEPRLAAAVLMTPTGGFASWLRSHEDNPRHLIRAELDRLPPERAAAWLAMLEPLEAAHWIGRERETPLLVQAGREDLAVKPETIDAWFELASPPRHILWYDAGHRLDATAFRDQAGFLARYLLFDVSRFVPPERIY
jgi:dienelactone hydrolase